MNIRPISHSDRGRPTAYHPGRNRATVRLAGVTTA